MRYQSLEINYHTAPINKSTALPILQKLISIMVCLLGRAEYTMTSWRLLNSLEVLQFNVAEKLTWSIRHLSNGLYTIQICEISQQTFGPSHQKCPTCPMISVNTQDSTRSFLAGFPKSHFLGWYRNFIVYWYLKLDNQVVNLSEGQISLDSISGRPSV